MNSFISSDAFIDFIYEYPRNISLNTSKLLGMSQVLDINI